MEEIKKSLLLLDYNLPQKTGDNLYHKPSTTEKNNKFAANAEWNNTLPGCVAKLTIKPLFIPL